MTIGFLGTGLMGEPMAQRLLLAQIPVIAYNRSPEKLQALQAAGAKIASDPVAIAKEADCLILMLTDATAIQALLLNEAVIPWLQGRTVLQMGTIAPLESQTLQTEFQSRGADYLEAPVLGSIPEAQAGTLQVMVGSTPKQFSQWSPLLAHFGSEPRYIGTVGAASAVKLALNQLIASLTSAFGLSLGFLQQQGVDVEKFMAILRQSAIYAPTFDKKLSRMLDRNYDQPNFPTKHLLKDVNLFLAQAQGLNLACDSLAGVQQIVTTAIAQGWADSDYSAIYSAINRDIV